MPFSKLGLPPALCSPLPRLGYTQPTPVQTACIPLVMEGADVLARAQTGTGKTAAFGLPMIARLLAGGSARGRLPRALVLVPTRELAQQVHKALVNYGGPGQLRVMSIFGGVPMSPQIRALKQGTHIVVATPGRLIDHLERRTIDLSAIEILTLDEADRMLDMGFQPALRRVIPLLPSARQTLLFSATLSTDVARLAAEFTRNPIRVDLSDGHVVAATVTHRVHPVAPDRKRDLLTACAQDRRRLTRRCLLQDEARIGPVGDYLERAGIPVAVIHGNKSQGARNRALQDFKAGRVSVLVATDIAARGLDIAELPLVVNYDLPLVAADYIHRVGRTGRAGREGRAVSLVSASEQPLLRDIQRLLPVPLEQIVVEGFGGSMASRAASDQRPPRHRPRPVRFARPARAHSFKPRRPAVQFGEPVA